MIVHAGCVARRTPGGWTGVLLFGPSGVGKSDLALRLIAQGWSLVADDRVQLWAAADQLYAKAPPALAGLIEVRGVDVLPVRRRELARVALVVRCVAPDAELDRIPERAREVLAGATVEHVVLRPREASAPAKVEFAFARALARRPGDPDF